MTSTPDLPVPDAALDAFRRLCSQVEPGWTREERVRKVAGPVVAAVLREEVDASEQRGELGDSFRAHLRARADQLDSTVSSR